VREYASAAASKGESVFGLSGREVGATARRLFDRAHEVEGRYLHLSMAALTEQVAADVPEHKRSVTPGNATFSYDDVPGFSFSIMVMVDQPVLTVFGEDGGRFSGFMLQRTSTAEYWHTAVEKPAAFALGVMAGRLADSFKRQFGLVNLTEFRRRLGH
jgi:hypothetical protein